MTHEALPRVVTPSQFMAATPSQRRRLVRRQLDLTPAAWKQARWIVIDENSMEDQWDVPPVERDVCGTAFCFAGWAIILASERFADEDCVAAEDEKTISKRAAELLGLPPRTCPCGCAATFPDENLFNGENEIEDIDRILDALDLNEASEL